MVIDPASFGVQINRRILVLQEHSYHLALGRMCPAQVDPLVIQALLVNKGVLYGVIVAVVQVAHIEGPQVFGG